MKKNALLFCFFLSVGLAKSQNISSGKWSDLFSYNNVLVLREDSDRIVAATENGIFYYTPSTGEIKKLSKANGLHEVKISAFDYNPETRIGLVGYESGALDVITPEGITLIVDIPIATGYTGSKKINHISITGNDAVVSVGYGVSIFKLDKKEFADTSFFINPNGTYTSANESIIQSNRVYSATADGIKSQEIVPVFPVYSNWSTLRAGNFSQIAVNASSVYAGTSTEIFKITSLNFSSFALVQASLSDIVLKENTVLISDGQLLKEYNEDGMLTKSLDAKELINTAILYKNEIFLGTKFSGVFNKNLQPYKPDGPYSNTSYKISLLKDEIYVSSGARVNYDLPIFNGLGYYHYNGNNWIYPQFFVINPPTYNILDVIPNPVKSGEVFFTNYSTNASNRGIFRMQNDEFVKRYYDLTFGPSYNRFVGFAYDDANQLFVSAKNLNNSAVAGLYSYDLARDEFKLLQSTTMNGAQKPFINDGVVYVPGSRGLGGFLMYDYKSTPLVAGDDVYKVLTKDNNLPISNAVSGIIDNDGDLWIGSSEGLRILSNPKSAISEVSPQTQNIVIEQSGIGEELFRDASILQIEVDSGNQKWVSIDGGGVFYLSPNGEQTLQNFTKANSPLPTNSVTDIKVDKRNGKVYFVTLDGIVVYQGDAVNVTSNFGDVLVYPNPVVLANFKGNVTIRGLALKTNIRITDAAGNLVHQAIARGGSYEWNLNNQRGRRVASGIYFVLMTNDDGTDTATAKIAVVN